MTFEVDFAELDKEMTVSFGEVQVVAKNCGISDEDVLIALIETDSLPAVTTTVGAILTDSSGNIILRY